MSKKKPTLRKKPTLHPEDQKPKLHPEWIDDVTPSVKLEDYGEMGYSFDDLIKMLKEVIHPEVSINPKLVLVRTEYQSTLVIVYNDLVKHKNPKHTQKKHQYEAGLRSWKIKRRYSEEDLERWEKERKQYAIDLKEWQLEESKRILKREGYNLVKVSTDDLYDGKTPEEIS